MADYSFGFGGIGSGLDISTMVNKLTAADRAPHDARLNKLESQAKFKLSGIGSVTSAFNALKSSLDNLQKVDSLAARSVTSVSSGAGASGASAIDTVLAASVGRNTPVGTYQVEVLSLASAHKLVGGSIESGTTFGAGSLQLSIGGQSVEIEVAADATLADIRSAINDAAGKHGVQAALLTSDQGQHLSIASTTTGAAHAISLSVNAGGSGLQDLVAGLEQRSPAADARVSIDGLVTNSSSNTITDAVPGLTLKLKDVGTSNVTVGADPAGSRAAVEGFVKAYNTALNTIANTTKYDAETRTPSSLTGDAQMRGATSQLRAAMADILGVLAGQGLDAKTLGLETQGHPNPNGNLVLDTGKFDAAMAENSARVIAAFTGENGAAAQLNAVVKSYVGTDGSLTLRQKGLNDQVKDVAKQRDALEVRMNANAERYKSQFLALDTLMAQMTSTSSYLSQQLNALSAQTQAR